MTMADDPAVHDCFIAGNRQERVSASPSALVKAR
jgi:hypothetical protein